MAFSYSLVRNPWVLPQKPKHPSQPPSHSSPSVVAFASLKDQKTLNTSAVSDLNLNHQVPPNFTSKDLLGVLRRQKDAESALRVFGWAMKQENFVPTASVYAESLQQLGKAGAFGDMKVVLQQMKRSGCKIN